MVTVERTCGHCSKVFLLPQQKLKHGRGGYCSRRCFDAWRTANATYHGRRDVYRMLQPGEAIPSWEPKRKRDQQGYVVLVWRVGSYSYVMVREHRLMAQADYGMHVHHVNGQRDDNRPENLQVLSPSEHIKWHRRQEALTR